MYSINIETLIIYIKNLYIYIYIYINHTSKIIKSNSRYIEIVNIRITSVLFRTGLSSCNDVKRTSKTCK